MWNRSRDKIEDFLVKANSFHPTIKFTAEISKTTLLDTKVYKGERFNKQAILTCEHISKLQKPFNTRISICVTHQASQRLYKRRSVKASENKFLSIYF